MLLLFAGSTPMIRSALAEKIVDGNPAWRHLAIEELAESAAATEGKDFDPEQLLAIVLSCAKTMQNEGYHLILSLTDASEFLPVIREETEGNFLSVHLGDPAENMRDAFDHVIDTSAASIKDIYAFLEPLIKEPPEA